MGTEGGNQEGKRGDPRPVGPYWDDPVYRYVSRLHRLAMEAEESGDADRFDGLMQQLADSAMPDEIYWKLDSEARAERKERRRQRKRMSRPSRPPSGSEEPSPSVNVADLKRRIYNPNVSRDNVIKALEALPPAERKATIAGLPPGLRRKLGAYLTGK
jgi:hypothetical protein